MTASRAGLFLGCPAPPMTSCPMPGTQIPRRFFSCLAMITAALCYNVADTLCRHRALAAKKKKKKTQPGSCDLLRAVALFPYFLPGEMFYYFIVFQKSIYRSENMQGSEGGGAGGPTTSTMGPWAMILPRRDRLEDVFKPVADRIPPDCALPAPRARQPGAKQEKNAPQPRNRIRIQTCITSSLKVSRPPQSDQYPTSKQELLVSWERREAAGTRGAEPRSLEWLHVSTRGLCTRDG